MAKKSTDENENPAKPKAVAKPKAPAKPKVKKKEVKPDTKVGGTLEIGTPFNLSNGKSAPDGKYKAGSHVYHIKGGLIVEIAAVE